MVMPLAFNTINIFCWRKAVRLPRENTCSVAKKPGGRFSLAVPLRLRLWRPAAYGRRCHKIPKASFVAVENENPVVYLTLHYS